MENFAKTVARRTGWHACQAHCPDPIGDLLSDGINLKGKALNFHDASWFKDGSGLQPARAIWIRDALKAGAKVKVKPADVKRDDLAFLQYTGGTTGVAKGAMLTHGNVLANCQQAFAWAGNQMTGEVETIVTPLPLYHIYSLTVNCLIFLGLVVVTC